MIDAEGCYKLNVVRLCCKFNVLHVVLHALRRPHATIMMLRCAINKMSVMCVTRIGAICGCAD